MKSALSTFRPGARQALLLASVTAAFVLTLALALYELDRQRYMNAKKEIITRDFHEMFRLPDELNQLAWDTLFGLTAADRDEAQQRLAATIKSIVDGPTAMYRFTLLDPQGMTVLQASNPAKFERLNTVDNNLFLQGFSGITDMRVTRKPLREGEPRLVGRLQAHYTTPADNAEIRALTVRYRWYAGVMIAAWSALYYLLYVGILRPMNRVTARLEMAKRGEVGLIAGAGSALERSYNAIASRAVIQDIQQDLNAAAAAGDATPAERVRAVDAAVAAVAAAFGLESLALAEVIEDGDERSVTGCHACPRDAAPPTAIILQHHAEAREAAGPTPSRTPLFMTAPDGWFIFAGLAAQPSPVAFGRLAPGPGDTEFRLDCVHRACEGLAQGLLAFRAAERNIVRQRSEANITLSRNLGHDLTNIIATTKLDLMAVRQLIAMPPGRKLDGQRAGLLAESVEGLMRSTRFLQEIVNIYRSFSHIKRPAFERHELGVLVGDFLSAFELTVSARVTIVREFEPVPGGLIVEPRLLKLALFNVLTNALDALKRAEPAVAAPRIVVRIAPGALPGEARIEIDDNGPGIRDYSGRLLARAETDAIFQYGYSTKNESEGLGLNWVRTIIHDFHDGAVRAENLPDGGARFSMVIRSMDSAEATVGEAPAAARAAGA